MFSTRNTSNGPALHEHQRRRHRGTPRSARPTSTSAPRTSTGSSGTPRQVRYYVDGTLVHDHSRQLRHHQMRPLASDFNSGGPNLSVDWLHLSPYPASGTFDSRVFDAGAGQTSTGARSPGTRRRRRGPGSRSASAPATRPTPDGTWSAFTPIASMAATSPGAPAIVQYRAVLSTTDPDQTPTLSEVTVSYVPGYPTDRGQRRPRRAEDSGATAIDVLANDQLNVRSASRWTSRRSISSSVHLQKQGSAITDGGTGLTYTPNPNYCNTRPADLDPDDFTYTLNGGSTHDRGRSPSAASTDTPTAVTRHQARFIEDSGADFAIDVLGQRQQRRRRPADDRLGHPARPRHGGDHRRRHRAHLHPEPELLQHATRRPRPTTSPTP